jgi:hypothetical protein
MSRILAKHWKVVVSVSVVILVFLLLFWGVTKIRVVGTWRSELSYSDYHGCATMAVIRFNEDGTYTRELYEADSNHVLNSEEGVWKIYFFEVQTRELGETGYAGYVFNPVLGTLKNGPHIYKSIS